MQEQLLRDLQRSMMDLREDFGELRGEMRGYMANMGRLEREGLHRAEKIDSIESWRDRVIGMAAATGAISGGIVGTVILIVQRYIGG